MSPDNDSGHTGPARGAYEEAQKQVRERNEEARRNAKKQRADEDQRNAAAKSKREQRDGVYR